MKIMGNKEEMQERPNGKLDNPEDWSIETREAQSKPEPYNLESFETPELQTYEEDLDIIYKWLITKIVPAFQAYVKGKRKDQHKTALKKALESAKKTAPKHIPNELADFIARYSSKPSIGFEEIDVFLNPESPIKNFPDLDLPVQKVVLAVNSLSKKINRLIKQRKQRLAQ